MNDEGVQGNYEFLDCGHGKRLEKIGNHTFIRQAPQAIWSLSQSSSWDNPSYEFKGGKQSPSWIVMDKSESIPHPFEYGSLKMDIRLSENGQIGIYPEQMDNWDWLSETIKPVMKPLRIFNGFAYTGASSIISALALGGNEHSEVCHLDASKSAVNWARANRDLSGLPDNAIRFIVDDISRFLERERKRGRRYNGMILDPPAFGRAKGGKTWVLKRDLPALMSLCRDVLDKEPLFFLLSCHDPEISKEELAGILAESINKESSEIETLDLTLVSEKGNSLPNGIAARWRS